MTDEVPDNIVIRCSRVEDIPFPPVPSTKTACRECGRQVWVSHSTRDIAIAQYPDIHLFAVCMKCELPGEEGQIVNLPEQVNVLRALGDSDEVIAYKFAIAAVAGANAAASLEEIEAEILAFPNGKRARAFPEALARATRLVMSTRLSRN